MTQTPNTPEFEYAIIGKGLLGAAAARHLSQQSDSVALIGPDEPKTWQTHKGVFASHYDEARIVSQSAPDSEWQTLDRASIVQYPVIEAQSGIRFSTPSGRLTALPKGEDIFYPYVASNAPNCLSSVNHAPFSFPDNYDVVFEKAPSGYLNPRQMVLAQTTCAELQGTAVIAQQVSRIELEQSLAKISLTNGELIYSKKVLLATGAFTNFFDLLPRQLALKPETITTVLAEVSEETAVHFKNMPPLNYMNPDGPLIHLSILPPIRYPNGRYYIKLFTFSDAERPLTKLDELTNWFKKERPFPYLDLAKEIMQALMPTIDFLSWEVKPCIVTYTPTWKPMIDCVVNGRVYVAVGGNGGSAHPSDAIGKLAADLMIHNEWRSHLEHKNFQAQYADDWSDWMSELTSVWMNLD